MQDKVSIITPSWNSEKYIEKTIESVQKQTYMNWEMIVVDDCSTDRTVEIVEKISKEDPRVRIIRQEVNGGAAKARNRSLCEATGRYIAYLDADDIWKPTKLEKQVEFMKANHCGFSCASYEVIDDEGRALNKEVHMMPSVDYVGFLTNNLLQTVGIMADTSIIDKKYITIMKSKFGAGWGVLYGGQSVFRYNNRRIDDFHTARLIAFDLFDEQHESRGEVQPYWDGMRWLYY